MRFVVKGTKEVELEISNSEIKNAVMQFIIQKYFDDDIDDAGCDWETKDEKTYIGGTLLSVNPNVASLVDAANILNYGKKLKFEEE